MCENKINEETKVCSKCGRELPLGAFRLLRGQFNNPYYRAECKECEVEYNRQYKAKQKEKRAVFSDDIQILYQRKYKEINLRRILDISELSIIPLATDEIFVKLMDYKDTWLSNYGRVIRKSYNKYNLLNGSYDRNSGGIKYTAPKEVFIDGKWIFKRSVLYVAQAVIDTFIVNPDKVNNTYIWHSGNNKEDNYYRNLYPLTEKQYYTVREYFRETGDDSEEYILKVMNDIRFKSDDWSKSWLNVRMAGVGYYGCDKKEVDTHSEVYYKWHNMMERCYNDKVHKNQPQYKECEVCEEWHNFNNFKKWYDEHKYGNRPLDLDKDILFKGNTIYSPETCCLVPHEINTLFTNGKANRGDLPLGVYFDKDKNKHRACMAFMGKSIKLDTLDTAEDAFARYKEYKEDFIEDMAELYKGKIPDKVYQAMLNWKIEVTD